MQAHCSLISRFVAVAMVKQEENMDTTMDVFRKGPLAKDDLADVANKDDLANKMAAIPGIPRPMQDAQSQVWIVIFQKSAIIS